MATWPLKRTQLLRYGAMGTGGNDTIVSKRFWEEFKKGKIKTELLGKPVGFGRMKMSAVCE